MQSLSYRWSMTVEKFIRKLDSGILQQKKYFGYFDAYKIRENVIFFENDKGNLLNGNIASLIKALVSDGRMSHFKVYLSTRSELVDDQRRILQKRNLSDRIEICVYGSLKYYKVLAFAKYLVSDSFFVPYYIKKKGQRVLLIWNTMYQKLCGAEAGNDYGMIAEPQRNLLLADQVIYRDEATFEGVVSDFFISNISKNEHYVCKLPATEMFSNAEAIVSIKASFEKLFGAASGVKTYVYFPCKRNPSKDYPLEFYRDKMIANMWQLDKALNNAPGIKVLAVLPNSPFDVASFVDWKGLRNIVKAPTEYDVYELLAASDGLITDYAGLMFDYAETGKPIYLFDHDRKAFFSNSDTFVPYDAVQFPKAQTAIELVTLLKSGVPQHFADTEHRAYKDTSARVLLDKLIFNKEDEALHRVYVPDNGLKNVVIYAGNMQRNGITMSFINLTRNLHLDQYNVIFYYWEESVKPGMEILKELPSEVGLLAVDKIRVLGLHESFFVNQRFVPYFYRKYLYNKWSRREKNRIFDAIRVDSAIQFNGYTNELIDLFGSLPCRTTLFSHNDMNMEIRTKHTVCRKLLADAFKTYDNIALVTEDLFPITEKIAKGCSLSNRKKPLNMVLSKNIINYKNIIEQGSKELLFDDKTRLSKDERDLRALLDNKYKTFITVGRYSAEKGHYRLIDEFDKLCEERDDISLIIVGGYGKLYNETRDYARTKKHGDRIALIFYMSNPYPLIRACDYFILPSLYEGFGLVLAEADILGLPAVSTDVVGPAVFMNRYGGHMVPNSNEGIRQALLDCLEGRVPEHFNIDYEQYNKAVIEQFEHVIGIS